MLAHNGTVVGMETEVTTSAELGAAYKIIEDRLGELSAGLASGVVGLGDCLVKEGEEALGDAYQGLRRIQEVIALSDAEGWCGSGM